MITAASLHPDLVPRNDVHLPIGHAWPTTMRVSQETLPMASPWNITPLHPMRVCSEPKLLYQLVLDFPVERFKFRHCDSDQFHKFTPDRNGKASTTAAEYYLYPMSQNLQYSKISSLEASQKIPYPLDRDRNFPRRYNNTFNRRLDDDIDEFSTQMDVLWTPTR